MKRLKSLLFAAAAAVALASGSAARADISWHIDWTPSVNFVTAGLDSTINFSNQANTHEVTTSALPVIPMPAANLTINTTTTGTDVFSPQNYSLSAKVTDDASGSSHIFNFSGSLSGTITQTGSAVANMYNAPTTLTATIGNNVYTVTLTGYVPPGTGDHQVAVGGFGADVTAVAGGSNGNPHDTPEPSTLALGGLGMMFTGLMGWRRRNRNAAVAG